MNIKVILWKESSAVLGEVRLLLSTSESGLDS